MGKHSREKGAQFERLICQLVRACDPLADVRRGKQSHLADEPDVVITAGQGLLPRLWLECHHGVVNPAAKLAQATMDVDRAERDNRNRSFIPIVIWRRTGSRSLNATMHADDFAVIAGIVPNDRVQIYGYETGAVNVTLDAGEALMLAMHAVEYRNGGTRPARKEAA